MASLYAVDASADDRIASSKSKIYSTDRKLTLEAVSALEQIAKQDVARSSDAEAILSAYRRQCQAYLASVGNDEEIEKDSLELRIKTPKPIAVADMRHAFFLREPIWLGVNSANFTDDHLAVIAQIPSITMIDIESAPVTGSALKHFGSRLISLRLRKCAIDELLLTQSQLENLKLLDISVTKVKNSFMKMANLPKLEELCIDGTEIDADGLRNLSRFKAMKWLRVDFSQVSAEGLKKIVEDNTALRRVTVCCASDELMAAAPLKVVPRSGCEIRLISP